MNYGTAWIAWNPSFGTDGEYVGYVERLGDEELPIEPSPATTNIEAVLSWARERTHRIRIRPEWDDAATYWAGASEENPGLPVLPVPN